MAEPAHQLSSAHSTLYVRPIPFKAHRVNGFSPETLEQHYEESYGGAVRQLNAVMRQLAAPDRTMLNPQQFASLVAKERSLSNSIALHEIYFDGLGEDGGEALTDPALQAALDARFGGVGNWWEDVRRLIAAWPGGPGWIVLWWSVNQSRMILTSLGPGQGIAGSIPLFALDMDEHAFSGDFGIDRSAYAETVHESLHWGRIAERFNAIGHCAPAETDTNLITVRDLAERIEDQPESLLLLDVRHDDDRLRYTSRIKETDWRDSFNVPAWADEFPRDRTIVVYCMYGFWISQKVAVELRERGFDARSLEGGIAAWRAMGLPSTELGS